VGTRVGLGDVKKRKFLTLPGLELRPLGRPSCFALMMATGKFSEMSVNQFTISSRYNLKVSIFDNMFSVMIYIFWICNIQFYCSLLPWKSHLRFLWGAADLNTKLWVS
jgi:hypothetical protein